MVSWWKRALGFPVGGFTGRQVPSVIDNKRTSCSGLLFWEVGVLATSVGPLGVCPLYPAGSVLGLGSSPFLLFISTKIIIIAIAAA